ncbi:MAG: hypothetical protein WCM93_02330 [Bacteroidota bacterium]
MKNLILILLELSLASALSAQIEASEYLNKAPTIPAKVCQLKTAQKDVFLKNVSDLNLLMDIDIHKRTKEANEYAESHRDEMQDAMLKNSGMSQAYIEKMKSGEMTETEKQEVANQMLQQKMNMNMTDVKNLQGMSKEGKEAWAQGYAAENMAVAQANPKQIQIDQNKNMKAYQLLSEQSTLRQKVVNQENTIRRIYHVLDSISEAEKVVLGKELEPLYKELNSINDGEGSTQADVDHSARVIEQIQGKQDKFCEKFTPRMLDFITKSKDFTERAIPDYDRLEQLQYEINASQTGTTLITAGKGLYSLQAVEIHIGYLAQAFRYKLYQVEE